MAIFCLLYSSKMHLLGAWVSSDSENRGLSTESSTVLSTLQVLLMGDVSLPTPSLNTSWAVPGRRVRDTAQTKGTKNRNSLGIPGCYKKE